MTRRFGGRLERLEQQLSPGAEGPDLAGEAAEFGELVAQGPDGRRYERIEADGRPTGTLVVDAPNGRTVAYQVPGVRMEMLM